MIVVGQIEGVVNASVYREFQNKDKNRTYRYNEISFYCEEKRFSGILKDWDVTVPLDLLKSGTKILVNYQSCQPKKDCFGVIEFSGFPQVLN